MKTSVLLEKYEYKVPLKSPVMAGRSQDIHSHPAPATMVLQVNLDFSKGRLTMGTIRPASLHPEEYRPYPEVFRPDAITVEAAIYPCDVIDLSDPETDGLVFLAEGFVADGHSTESCSGLIVIDNIRNADGLIGSCWMISIYLNDQTPAAHELKLKIPVFTSPATSTSN